MDYTIKIHTAQGNERVVPAHGEIGIYLEGQKAFQECVDDAVSNGAVPDGCRAILSYKTGEYGSFTYLYEGDRAYIMNNYGKTVAVV